MGLQHYANMLWLDSTYPTNGTGQPGYDRGDCATTSGVPADVESKQASSVSNKPKRPYSKATQGV